MLEILALASVFLLEPPTHAPSDGAPGSSDILKGPDVPAAAHKPAGKDRPKAEGAASDKVSRPMLEQRVLFASLDGLKLDDARRQQVKALRVEFERAVADWAQKSEVKKKELFDKRKSTPTGKPVSDDFKKGMEEIEAKRPKLGELKERLAKVLSPDEMEQLRVAYADGLKRAHDELTKRTEEERAKQEAARKKKAEESEKRKMEERERTPGA